MKRHAEHHVNDFGEGRHHNGCVQHQHEPEHLGRDEGDGCWHNRHEEHADLSGGSNGCVQHQHEPEHLGQHEGDGCWHDWQDGHADVSGASGFVGGEFASLGMANISPASLVSLLFEALIHNGPAQWGAPRILDGPTTITEVNAPITVFANDQIQGSVGIDNSQHTQNYVHDAFPFPGVGPTTITEISAPITIFANDQIQGSVGIDNSQHAQNYVDGSHYLFGLV
jgi:hypothetical protein